LEKTADGSYVIAGLMNSSLITDSAQAPFVYTFNAQGDSLQFSSFSQPVWRLGALLIDEQGDFLIAGVINKSDDTTFSKEYGDNLWFAKLNSNGNLIWEKQSNPYHIYVNK